MNIFYTSTNPRICATVLDDKRVVKMCLETAQMLSTAVQLQYTCALPKSSDVKLLYQPTHSHHPCNMWVRESPYNFVWLTLHHQALCDEYLRRFFKIHDSYTIGLICAELFPDIIYTVSWAGLHTTPPNCARNNSLGIDCTSFNSSIIECYREYLRQRWATDKRAPKWTAPAKHPEWR